MQRPVPTNDMTPTNRCEKNISEHLVFLGAPPDSLVLNRAEYDRCFFEPRGKFLAWLMRSGLFEEWNEVKNHGETAVRGWREVGARPSMQAVLHSFDEGMRWEVEIDFDLWNPAWGLIPAAAHFFGEVLPNKLTGRKTNPEKVARLLARRWSEESA